MNRIKNLLFDFGGVLVDLDRERCIRSFENLGLNVRPFIGEYRQDGPLEQLECGRISTESFCEAIRRLCGNPDVTDRDIVGAWESFLLTIPHERLDALLCLRRRYPLYLLSNTNIVHWEMARNDLFLYKGNTVDDFFRRCFLSYEVGVEKPDPIIYNAVLEGAGIRAEETLFIDDSEENCAAARALGLHAFCPHRPGEWMDYLKQEGFDA